ncbi:MAG: hypothetical protein NTV51_13960 [Verrucomicrobia bacterium]|nr:hypothetical protein [Verrucomicrobiota bacterium]
MKRPLLIILSLAWFLSAASAKVINVRSCSQDDFEDAYYRQSVPGDILVLPAGTGTWGASSRPNEGVIYIITNVTVIGQGDSTVITLADTGKTYANGVIAVWGQATFARMKIIGSNANPVTAFQIVPYTNTGGAPYSEPGKGISFTGGFRLTDITYVGGQGPTADAYFAFVSQGIENGLIDNCRITGRNGSAELILGRGINNAGLLDAPFGSANNVFIEDCTFNGTGYVCDANSLASFVVRFNTINGSNKVDGHGLASNSPPRSFRSLEVYRNRWTGGGTSATAIEIRGGTAMIFDNTSDFAGASAAGDRFFLTDYGYQGLWPNFGVQVASVTAGNPTTITTVAPHGYANGMPVVVTVTPTTPPIANAFNITVTGPSTFTIPFATTVGATIPLNSNQGNTTIYMTPANYPIKDQVGVSKDPKTAGGDPAYIFNNRKGGVVWTRNSSPIAASAITTYQVQTSNPSATFTDTDLIQSNRDFFSEAGFDANTGVSTGTKAQMLAFTPSVVGYGWWVTDEGSWNKKLPANTSGQLYTWRGVATGWQLKYTPYTYPHPARLPIPASNLRFNP